MSASNKKKLRKELEASKLTEKQVAAAQEAKKVRLYTVAFTAVLVVLLVVAIGVGAVQTIENMGLKEKNTTAYTVNGHEINSVEMNYFFLGAVNEFYSSNGAYASIFGLDLTTPLDEQVTNEETGATWADDFAASAKDTALNVYNMADAANAAGFTLTAQQEADIDATMEELKTTAALYGYTSANDYLKAMFGNGASTKSYSEYLKLRTLASAYQSEYYNGLSYDDAALRAADAEDPAAYSAYSYNVYSVTASSFLTGGTTDSEGTTTYSDAEKAASVKAAKEAADAIADAEITDAASFDAAIASVVEGASSTAYTDTLYSSVSTIYADWVTNSARKAGDVSVFENSYTSGEETTVSGYYVVLFNGSNDNTFALKNVRHILVSFEHDHEAAGEDHDHSTSSYTDEEIAAAKATAEELLAQWQSGEATEDSFAALANEKSADGDGTTGGLYENIYPNQMVENFEAWCYEDGRKPGDTGIVESTYGYHVMYFVSDSEMNYRDYMIDSALRSADYSAWITGLNEAAVLTDGDMQYVHTDLVLQAS